MTTERPELDRPGLPANAAPIVPMSGAAVRAPAAFHVVAKPSGSDCNIDCKYCFFLSKAALYANQRQRMSHETLETYLRQLLESRPGSAVTITWQGGEPTLMGVDFFREAFAIVERYRRPEQRVQHTLQTNGIALDDDWCAFLKENQVLVGLSVDGPQALHDAYRVTRAGKGSFELVMNGWRALRRHRVEFNVLCTVNAANQAHGRRVYRFLRDELGAQFIQFIPIVERATAQTIAIANRGWSQTERDARLLYTQSGSLVTERSVDPASYGQFLVDVFEEWVRHDIGKVYVRLFDVALEARFGRHLLCIHAPTCGRGLALEHNGDLYSCDHFVEPAFLLGNIHRTPMSELAASPQQSAFGQSKVTTLTHQCRRCDVLAWCNGGCPKDRFGISADGEPGHNHLCAGIHRFFAHIGPAMERMETLINQGRAPADLMRETALQDARRGIYAPCVCGSGRKFRFCHAAAG